MKWFRRAGYYCVSRKAAILLYFVTENNTSFTNIILCLNIFHNLVYNTAAFHASLQKAAILLCECYKRKNNLSKHNTTFANIATKNLSGSVILNLANRYHLKKNLALVRLSLPHLSQSLFFRSSRLKNHAL